MPRIAILISLLVSLGLFIRGGVMLWKTEPLPDIKAAKKEKTPPGIREQKPVIFFPQVPQQPPNLRDGYLFNENRALIEEDQQAATSEEPVVEETPAIDLEGLEFIGSIITKTVRKAMVLYQPVEDVPQQPPPPPQPQVRGWRRPQQGAGTGPLPRGSMPPMNAMPVPSGEKKHAILNEGEEFQGFLVLGVFPDKLVLEKGENRYEKTLYVPGKARAGGEGGGMPQAAMGGGESRSRTIGGNASMQMPGGGGRLSPSPMQGNTQMHGRMPQVPGQPSISSGPGVPANIVPPAPVPHSIGQAPIYGNFPQGSPPVMAPNQQNRPNQ